MTTPVITDFPLPFPAKGQSDTDFDNNVDAYLSWLSGTNVPELQIALPWVQARLEEVAATALSGTLPDISAQALNLLRVNAGASAVEFRTPAQVLADIGAATSASVALKAPLASPALTGTPTAPTAAAATNTTQIATTAFVVATAQPKAKTSTGAGQFLQITSSVGVALVLPAGGTWAYFGQRIASSSGGILAVVAGINAGGSTILTASAGNSGEGWAWRTTQ